jgi:hypothetical protein
MTIQENAFFRFQRHARVAGTLAMSALLVALPALPALAQQYGQPAADSMSGRWMGVGRSADKGVPFSQTLYFGPNGQLQMEFAISSDPRTGLGSGITRCEGSYRYDGTALSTSYSSCAACPAGMQCFAAPQAVPTFNAAGPVQFAEANAFRWGDLVFRRQ